MITLSRHVEKLIKAWASEGKKPLLITGARQVGKTFIVRECPRSADPLA